ncbi:MAG: UMP kinase [Candidatus Paceibacterota bacterium]|jgi:uridylate kinase
MKYNFKKIVVIGLGGSIVYQDGIDWKFLRDFKKCIERHITTHQFIIGVGGGRLARGAQEAVGKVKTLTNVEKDWLGIYATRLNAKIVQTVFGALTDKEMVDARGKITKLRKPVTLACGWTPGWSTDYISAVLAYDFGAHEVIEAGKPAFIYDKNPDEFKGAKPFEEMSWQEYWKIIPHKWVSGASVPIDPVAAKFSKMHNVAAIVIDGKNIKNLDALLGGKEFKGTIVR